MKALRGIDGSICGAIFSNRPPSLSAATTVAATAAAATAAPLPRAPNRRLNTSQPDRTCHGERPGCSRPEMSGHCPRTSHWLLSTFLPGPAVSLISLPRGRHPQRQFRRYSHAAAAASSSRPQSTSYGHPKQKDLLSVVGNGDPGTVDDHLELIRDPYLRRYAQPDGPNLTISDKNEDIQYPSPDQAVRGDPNITQITEKLRMALSTRFRHPSRVGLRSIYKLYFALPQPRMLHLPARLRHRFLKALGTPRRRNSKSMLRYFSLISDVKDCGLTLQRREWNTAMAFAGQYVSRTTDAEIESALQLWNEMEKGGGQRANGVTFNILFDAAAKSGNFALAERIYKEMESRGFQFNRYHHVSLIHFFGLKGDGDGIRAAYKEMVNAGEMIDTVVLNCVISSFLRAGDEAAATRVYDHMKSATITATSRLVHDHHMSRLTTQVLMMFSKVGREHPSMRPSLQGVAGDSPNLHTYRILLDHFAWTKGDMNKVVQFLDEMRWFDVPIHGGLFLILFKGFAKHGGSRHSGWTSERLHKVFSSMLHAVQDKGSEVYIDTWLAGWALRAFMKCAGREAVLDAYQQLQACWELQPDRAAHMEEFLGEVLAGRRPAVFTREDALRSSRGS